MKLLLLYLANRGCGYGHYYRCQALIQTAGQLGHEIHTISDSTFAYHLLTGGLEDKQTIYAALTWRPEWLIIDLQESAPRWLIDMARAFNAKLANLNGVGRIDENNEADVVWTQDTPERVILRQSVLNTTWLSGYKWFVWGGGADKLGLLPYFAATVPEAHAWLVHTDMIPNDTMPGSRQQESIRTYNNNYLWYLSKCKQVCAAFGMAAWENACLKIPQHLVSLTPTHLYFAQNMANLGLAKVWPQVGLPAKDEFRAWLQEPFMPTGQRPDGLGAQRFLEELTK